LATILLGYVLGPLMEENFRRTLLLSRGDLLVFLERPVSAVVMLSLCALLVLAQMILWTRRNFKQWK
jgi:TctA family transporter